MVCSAFHSMKAVVSQVSARLGTMPLLSIKETLQLPLSTRAVPADDDPPLSELLTELQEVISNQSAYFTPPAWHVFIHICGNS